MLSKKLVFMAFFFIVIILMTLQGYSGSTKGKKKDGACAACRHQKRRCSADCMFHRYFPANRPQDYRNFHRLFRVHKTEEMFKKMSQNDRDEAAKSIKYQSNFRALLPVHGCLQVISTLKYQIALLSAELNLIRTQIANFIPASNRAAAAVFNPAVTGFNPSAAYNPFATGFSPAAVFNPPATAFSSFSAGESSSSHLRNSSTNLAVNNDYFTRVPSRDGTIDFFSGGGHCGNSGDRECVSKTRPLERTSVQQFLPNPNNLGSCPAAANNANNNNENAIDSDFADDYEAFVGAPPPNYDNQIHPNNDNQLQYDVLN